MVREDDTKIHKMREILHTYRQGVLGVIMDQRAERLVVDVAPFAPRQPISALFLVDKEM